MIVNGARSTLMDLTVRSHMMSKQYLPLHVVLVIKS